MKNSCNIFLFIFLVHIKVANALDIIGLWEQDVSTQSDFNNVMTVLSNKDKEKYECGKQKLLFKKNILVISLEETTCKINGKKITIYPYNNSYYYRVLYKNDATLAIELIDKSGDDSHIEVYHFINENQFWLYYYGETSKGKMHLRNYYRRVQSET